MRTLFLSLAAVVGLATSASAQVGFMPYVGYNLEDEDFLVGVGARFGVPLTLPVALVAQPTVGYQFAGEGIDIIQADLNAVVEFTGSPTIAPYAGLGLGLTYASFDVSRNDSESETELGLNAVGGIVLNPVGFGRPFLQGRYATRGDFQDAFSVQAGVILGLN